jgi:branched-subunit amino acid aminotransferase/4-amino-4-deoxychorismate lyase
LSEPIVSLNGRIMPLREAGLSIVDDGIVRGATITERIRTFRQRPFRLGEHLDRLRRSLQVTGIAPATLVETLPQQIDGVLDHNGRLIADWQDLAIVVFVTPGTNPAFGRATLHAGPTVCVHTTPLPPPHWAALAAEGVQLVTPSVRQTPNNVVDPAIKHRSRLHWYLADRQATQTHPHAQALLLDQRGCLTETSTGNLIVFDGRRLLTPHPDRVLGGISRQVVKELAAVHSIDMAAADLTTADVLASREAFLSSSGYCLLPVTRLNGRAVGDGRPGPMYERLISDWSASVDVDILTQFQQAADETQT